MRIKKNGFTFIELLVVVTIIAVLTGIAAVSYSQTNKKSRDTRRKTDIEQIRSALEICRAETGAYPNDVTKALGVECDGESYISSAQMPVDPQDPLVEYDYTKPGGADTYLLCSNAMENENNPYCVTNP